MLQIKKKYNCCGCGACAMVCPQECITMKEDLEGFLYPEIETEKCVNCHLCEKVCPVFKTNTVSVETVGYAMYNRDDSIRMKSSSGGVFYELAKDILSIGGLIFGAVMAEDCRSVTHVEISDMEDIELLMGSKYVQSNVNNCYQSVKAYLKADKPVLFSGTPCQIAGLKSYLQQDYDNLFCVDFICHAIPSPGIWRQYIDWQEKRNNSKVVRTNFRCKRNGWKRYGMLLDFSNGTEYYADHAEDYYMRLFLQNMSVRPSCYHCRFRGIDRVSDITIADFWDGDSVIKGIDDDKGLSLVMVHSDKGAKLVKRQNQSIVMQKVDLHQALRKNPAVYENPILLPRRRRFFRCSQKNSFEVFAAKYSVPPFWKICLSKIRRIVCY